MWGVPGGTKPPPKTIPGVLCRRTWVPDGTKPPSPGVLSRRTWVPDGTKPLSFCTLGADLHEIPPPVVCGVGCPVGCGMEGGVGCPHAFAIFNLKFNFALHLPSSELAAHMPLLYSI